MNRDYLISNKAYDVLTRFVEIVLPGFAVLYVSLSELWDLPNALAVAGTLAGVATFLGVLLKFADNSWDNSESKYDGNLITTGQDPDTGIPDLALNITTDPYSLVSQDVVLLRSVDERDV